MSRFHFFLPALLLAVPLLASSCTDRRGGSTPDDDDDDDGGTTGPRDQCDAYLTCVADIAPTTLTSAQAEYGATGACWEAGTEFWEACGRACEQLHRSLWQSNPGSDDCRIPWYDSNSPSLDTEGTDTGDVAPDVRGKDQYGHDFHARQFHGDPVVLFLTATWLPTPPPEWSRDFQTTYEDDFGDTARFIFGLIAGDTPGQELTELDIYEYAEQFDLWSVPVLGVESAGGFQEDWALEGIPIIFILDDDWRVLGTLSQSADYEDVVGVLRGR